jgi:hypothetical protein
MPPAPLLDRSDRSSVVELVGNPAGHAQSLEKDARRQHDFEVGALPDLVDEVHQAIVLEVIPGTSRT